MTSGWLFLTAILGIIALGVVLEVWQRRIVRQDMDRRRQHRDLMREVDRHARIEPIEPRKPR